MGKGIDDSQKSDAKVDALVGADPGPQGAAVVAVQEALASIEARLAAVEAKVGL